MAKVETEVVTGVAELDDADADPRASTLAIGKWAELAAETDRARLPS